MTKHLLYDIDADTYQTAIEKGITAGATARQTSDCQKGIAGFLEKWKYSEADRIAVRGTKP